MSNCFKKALNFITHVSLIFLLIGGFAGAITYKLQEVYNISYLKHARELSGDKSATLYASSLGRFAFFSDKTRQGYLFLSADYAVPKGYRGSTSVMFMLDKTGSTIIDIKLIESKDTRSYVDYFVKQKYFDRYKQQSIAYQKENPAVIVNVDAVSGATRSCDAIRLSVEKTLEIVKPMISSMQLKQERIFNPKYQVRILAE
jgi:hypothetical protein